MTKKINHENMTREQVEYTMQCFAIASYQLAGQNAEMNEEIAAVRKKYEAEIGALEETVERHGTALQAWADAHPEEFKERKSFPLMHGVIGYRTGKPAVKPRSGFTWERITALVKDLMPEYIRTAEEVNKEQILIDRETLTDKQLKDIGVRIDQAEKFYVEPKKEEAKA